MAAPVSDLDLYISLCDKLGDRATRQLIQFIKDVKIGRHEVYRDVANERSSLATKDDLAQFASEIKQEVPGLRTDVKKGL